ncbi:hypothetical protein GQ457_09G001640 [Hibiscus cannabinus]
MLHKPPFALVGFSVFTSVLSQQCHSALCCDPELDVNGETDKIFMVDKVNSVTVLVFTIQSFIFLVCSGGFNDIDYSSLYYPFMPSFLILLVSVMHSFHQGSWSLH